MMIKNKRILIVAATFIEVEQILLSLKLKKAFQSNFNRFTFQKHQIDVLVTGIGMVATSYWMSKIISTHSYDFAINIGIAGSFDKKLKLGSVVNVSSDCFSELGAQDGDQFLSILDIGLMNKKHFTFKNNTLTNSSHFSPFIQKIKKVKGITSNTIHANDKSIIDLKKRFKPTVESMEGAAFMYVCSLEGISYIQLRAISNYIEGKRNKKNWDIAIALKNLSQTLLFILNE